MRGPVRVLVGQLQIRCRDLAVAAAFQIIGNFLAIGETSKTRMFDCRNMDECVLATIIGGDEAEAL